MPGDITGIVLGVITLGVFLSAFVISLIFTYSVDMYHAIDEALALQIIPSRILTPLEQPINIIEDWLSRYHRITGPIIALLCLFDMRVCFYVMELWSGLRLNA
jgi:hypothetical protein